jgi:hypothetical protein
MPDRFAIVIDRYYRVKYKDPEITVIKSRQTDNIYPQTVTRWIINSQSLMMFSLDAGKNKRL